jgi:hypothetical protein
MSIPVLVNRQHLYNALDSIIPHVGTPTRLLDVVGFEDCGDDIQLYATDRFTAGVARIHKATGTIGTLSPVQLPKSEALGLLRSIRPTLKAHSEDTVQLIVGPAEFPGGEDELSEVHTALHAQWGDEDAVFFGPAVTGSDITYDKLMQLVAQMCQRGDEDTPLIFNPAYLARFNKAAVDDSVKMRIHPLRKGEAGAAVVTVGSDFLGMIAGMKSRMQNDDPTEGYFDEQLSRWNIGNRQILLAS